MSTIYALATARGKSGVAVIRVSGPDAFCELSKIVGALPKPRSSALRKVRNACGELIDFALVLTFEKGASFTGEDVVELHLHGGVATINAMLGVLSENKNLTLAQPGEFTRRALENGCLDLSQVEGLSDLIEAETEAQRKQAIKVFSGGLGDKANVWRKKLIRAMALVEATIDFADEDVPVDVTPEVTELINSVLPELQSELSGAKAAERIRDGFEVAIIGEPNVGKSTLLNCLAGRDAAITSEIAGTTRDIIEVRMDLSGIPVTFLDTAGLRATDDTVESLGVERAVSRAKNADLRVFLYIGEQNFTHISPRDDDIVLHAKADIFPNVVDGISGESQKGVSSLVQTITDTLETRVAGASSLIRARHQEALETAILMLNTALEHLCALDDKSEIVSEYLRIAVRALDSLVGRVDVEHILDEIFSSFCLGK